MQESAAPVTPPRVPGRLRAALRQLVAQPHRLYFAAGTLVWCEAALWWLAVTLAPSRGLGSAWAVAAPAAHGLFFVLGFMPAFMAGFAFTAAPLWLQQPAPAMTRLRGPALPWCAGWLLLPVGLHWHAPLAAAALAASAAGWTGLAARFIVLLQRSRAADRRHAGGIALGMAVIALALWLAATALALESTHLLRLAVRLGLWGGAATVFLVAAHRLTHFLHGSGHTGGWGLLGPLLAGAWLRGLDEGLDLLGVARPGLWQGSLALLQAALAVALLRALLDPALRRALRSDLPRLLQRALLWWVLAGGLEAAAQGLRAAGRPPGGLGEASLHAVTLGFMASTLLAMAARITVTRQGRAVAIDRMLRATFGLLQFATAARLVAALWHSQDPAGAGLWRTLAALAFAVVALAWAVHPGRWLAMTAPPPAPSRRAQPDP